MMKLKLFLIALTVLLLSTGSVSALTTLNFEDLPLEYIYTSSEPINLGSYYSGVNFGPYVGILDTEFSGGRYPSATFPPHSGNAVFHTFPIGPAEITFDSPVNYVGGWFTFYDYPGYLEAFDKDGNLVDSDNMAPNAGFNAEMSVSGAGIKKVSIFNEAHNYYWTGDDITYGSGVVPEPASMLLFGLGGLAIGVFKKRKKV